MVVAMMYPEAQSKGGRGKTSPESAGFPMVRATSLRSARKVLRLAGPVTPPLATA